jgi:hypothetical protein
VVVSSTQQATAAHPPSHPWRRLDLHPRRRPQPHVFLRCCNSLF